VTSQSINSKDVLGKASKRVSIGLKVTKITLNNANVMIGLAYVGRNWDPHES